MGLTNLYQGFLNRLPQSTNTRLAPLRAAADTAQIALYNASTEKGLIPACFALEQQAVGLLTIAVKKPGIADLA